MPHRGLHSINGRAIGLENPEPVPECNPQLLEVVLLLFRREVFAQDSPRATMDDAICGKFEYGLNTKSANSAWYWDTSGSEEGRSQSGSVIDPLTVVHAWLFGS